LEGVEVLVLGGDFNAAAHPAGAIKHQATGVGNVGAVNVDPVVMEPLIQGSRGADPGAVLALRQRDSAPFRPTRAGLPPGQAKRERSTRFSWLDSLEHDDFPENYLITSKLT